MATTIKRKLYKRGSSFETTIPMPLLFALNKDNKYNVLFKFDEVTMRWYIDFELAEPNDTHRDRKSSDKQVQTRGKRGKKRR